jgi:hypothetical protein
MSCGGSSKVEFVIEPSFRPIPRYFQLNSCIFPGDRHWAVCSFALFCERKISASRVISLYSIYLSEDRLFLNASRTILSSLFN